MRVLMIVSNDVIHDPRVLREAQALRRAGHQVTFLGRDERGLAPTQEVWDDFTILRVRTQRNLPPPASDLFRTFVWWRRAARIARAVDFDAIHCHDLDTLPIGVRLKKKTGKPLVYDAHEVFGYMIEEDQPRFVVRAAFRLEARLAPQADRVIAVNEAVKAYVDRVSGKKAVVVRNVQDLVTRDYQSPPTSPFTLLYIGTLHRSRFILPAIDVAASMPDIRLVIGGGKALAEEVARRCAQHPNTRYLGIVPAERVLPLTLDSHAVLSMFDPRHRINQVGVPNKIFEAMAAGRPSIVTEGLFMATIVERNQCGLAVPYTEGGLRRAIETLRDDPHFAEKLGRSGYAASRREYNWQEEQKKLVELYRGLEPGR